MNEKFAELAKYRHLLHSNGDYPMHRSFLKNFRDYVCYFIVVMAIAAVVLQLAYPDLGQALLIAPLLGFISALTAFIRDGQHRQVPWSLCNSPRRFAWEMEVALDSGLSQLKVAEETALTVQHSVDQLAEAIAAGQRIFTPETEEAAGSVYLGRGFD